MTRRSEPTAIALSYWSPSAGNFLSSLVMALGIDLQHRAHAIEVLKTISNSSRDELLHLLTEPDRSTYRQLCADAFASIRVRAIALVKACIDASRPSPVQLRDMRRIADRRVSPGFHVAHEQRHITDRRRQPRKFR
jgi:hypothetical protein